jgi:soluble cytochrome b562
MTKVLFILSAVVIGVSIVFAWKNFDEFKTARGKVIVANQQLDKERNAVLKAEAEVKKIIADIAGAQQELDVALEKKKAQSLRVAQAENEAKRVADETAATDKKLAMLNEQLAKLPPGITAANLGEQINLMKQTIANLQGEAELKKKDVAAQEEKVTAARHALDEIERKIEERRKAFDRNSLTAQIVAVNRDWGFVVINAGQTQGITEATKLLVTRGSHTVGKLNIISVQGNRTVANILPDTLAQGMSIQPGDRVILENLFQ